MADRQGAAQLLPRAALSALLGSALALGVLAPAYANPTDVPDAGTRPAPAGEVPLPDGSSSRIPASLNGMEGPLASEIAETESRIAALVAQLRGLEPQLVDATEIRVAAEAGWQDADQARAEAEQALTELVDEAFRSAAAMLPHLTGVPLRELSAHAPLAVDAPLGVEAAGRKLLRAESVADRAEAERTAALETERSLDGQIRAYETELANLQVELEDLRDRNAAALAEQEAEDQRRAAARDFPLQDSVAGLAAGERAHQAVEFALQQLGKPYLWGAQGPDRYDCSGLVWDAYRSVGITVPRVAADQFHGTRSNPVARHALLPGDLVFFSSSPTDWRQIHHVGMYVGDGRMVHAPNRNEVVKVSPVWWSRFFGATRVVEAVRVEEPAPSPSPSPSPSPRPGPTPPPTTPPPTTPAPTTPPPTTPPPTTVIVPDVVGMSASAAAQTIEDHGLVPLAGDPVTEGCDQPGEVAEQDPDPGGQVTQGSTVTYRICEPAVPELTGMSQQDALAALNAFTSLGFGIDVDVVYVLSQEQDPGTVVSVEPAPGTPMAEVDTVTLTIVGVEVPDVVGESVGTAIGILQAEGFEVEQNGDGHEVTSQDPASGVHPFGSVVIIYV